jgi:hypothetical protein
MIVNVRSIIGQKIKINHDRKLFRLKVKHNYNLKKRRRLEQGIPKIVCGSIRKHKYDGYISVSAPICFSAVDNETQTLRFIQEVRKLYEKRQKVFVVLKNVSYITNDAILLLLANMIRFRAANLKFNGDYPTNRQVRDKLIASGFFRHLYDKVRNEDKYNLSESGGLIYTHAHKIVDSVQADLIVKDASQFIWGTPQRCLGVQRTFVELMQNTHNHASQKRKGEHHWWVSLSKDESKKMFRFLFWILALVYLTVYLIKRKETSSMGGNKICINFSPCRNRMTSY